MPCGTLTTCLASKGIFLLSASFCRSARLSSGPARTFLRLLVDQIELVARGLLAGVGARALRAARDGVEERQRGRDARVAGRLPAGHVRVLRIGLAVGPEDAALPVVEPHLGGGADLRGRLVGVLDVGQRDVDLVGARALQARLGDADLVDALAHDVQRAVDGVAGDRRLLGRLGLVDERDAALEVEAQARRLRRDDRQRRHQQAGDEKQDEEVATTVGHSGGDG